MQENRWKVYWRDLSEKGWKEFISERMKKRPLTRKIWYFKTKPYVNIGKMRLYVNKMDTVVGEKLLSEGVWEKEMSRLFLKYARKPDLIVDVGANIGYYSLLGAQRTKVIAFEPETENFNYLKRSIEYNGIENIRAIKKAVGDKKGKIKLYKDSENLGDHRSYKSDQGDDFEIVEQITLDSYFKNEETRIGVLKIDIQGYEYKAMSGAKKLLQKKKIKVILSELWPEGMAMAGDNWKNYIKMLEKYGYKVWEVDEETGEVKKFDMDTVERRWKERKDFTTNILAKLDV